MLRKIDETLNIALFPFKDIQFFKEDKMIKINRLSNKKRGEKQKELQELIRWDLIHKYSIRNADEVNLMIKKYYPFLKSLPNKLECMDDEQRDMMVYQKYMEIISTFAKCLISHRDGKVVYKHWKNEADDEFLGPYSELEKVQIFYNLNKVISMDLLTSSYFVDNKIVTGINDMNQLDNFYSVIELADKQLEEILEKGVSENHIHASASFNFCMSWDAIMNQRVEEKYYKQVKLNGFAGKEFENNSREFFKIAYILRTVIAYFLKENEEGICCNGFCKWIYNKFDFSNKVIEIFKTPEIFLTGEDVNNDKLVEIIEEIKLKLRIDSDDRENDIIFKIFHEHEGIKTYGENIFLSKCMIYMKEQFKRKEKDTGDTLFFESFFRYIRIKNETYQQLVQGNNIKGLTFFQEYFRRSTDVMNYGMISTKEYNKLMLRTLFQNEYLKKVELRISSINNEQKLRRRVKNILSAYKEVLISDYLSEEDSTVDFPRMGIVFHLIKKEEKEPTEKCWKMYKVGREATYNELSYRKIQNEYNEHVRLIREIRNEPYMSHFVLGLDAASNENNTPVEVFAPVYEEARDSSKDGLNQRVRNQTIKYKSLAFTLHAGEDFRHLVSGLRRVDEVVERCKFLSGDRIGHATALGVDIDYWSKRNPVVIIPRGEYFDNLIWMWGKYTEINNVNPKVITYLEQEIYKISKAIFENTCGMTPAMLHEVYERKFIRNDESLEKRNKKSVKKNVECAVDPIFCIRAEKFEQIIWDSEKIFLSHSCKCYLENMHEPIYVQVRDIDKEIMKEIQRWIIKMVADKGIVVEVNPTSNAIIGEIQDMFHNQAFAINKIDDAESHNVMFNINTDDPMVFNTNISNEYAYLYYGLLYRGACKEETLEWIEKRRKCGMESSFINSKLTNKEYYDYLCRALKQLGEE